MDLTEQNKLADNIAKVLKKELKDVPIHFILAVADKPGDGFAFSITSVTEKNSFEDCRTIVRGIANEANALVEKFDISANVKIKKPIEPK